VMVSFSRRCQYDIGPCRLHRFEEVVSHDTRRGVGDQSRDAVIALTNVRRLRPKINEDEAGKGFVFCIICQYCQGSIPTSPRVGPTRTVARSHRTPGHATLDQRGWVSDSTGRSSTRSASTIHSAAFFPRRARFQTRFSVAINIALTIRCLGCHAYALAPVRHSFLALNTDWISLGTNMQVRTRRLRRRSAARRLSQGH
jgi:hypothetical protein